MSEYTPEPWVCNENEYDDFIWGPNREMIAESRGTGGNLPQFENRRRIVACVNACADISTEELESTVSLEKALTDHKAEIARLRDKVAAYRRTLRDFRDNWDCDEDAHRHGTTCRVCEASEVLGHFAEAALAATEKEK